MIDDNDDDNFNRKAALKLHLPQSYSPMHSSRTKDCTAQKTIQPSKEGKISPRLTNTPKSIYEDNISLAKHF